MVGSNSADTEVHFQGRAEDVWKAANLWLRLYNYIEKPAMPQGGNEGHSKGYRDLMEILLTSPDTAPTLLPQTLPTTGTWIWPISRT